MTKVTISGPGISINYPTEVIIKALKEAGLQVEVEDDYRSENPKETLRRTKERIDSGEFENWKIKVETDHLPWGG